VVGPRVFTTSINANYQAVAEINSNSNIKIHNSILAGFPTGVRFNGSGTNAAVSGSYLFRNAANTSTGGGSNLPTDFATVNQVLGDSASFVGQVWASAPSFTNFNPLLAGSSPLASGAAPVAGFDAVTYVGAFGSSADAGWNWGQPWIEFDPVNKAY
jgi:hypothetical protein